MIKLWSKTLCIICYIVGTYLLFLTIIGIIYGFNIYILIPGGLALLCLAYAIFSPRLIIKDKILKIKRGIFKTYIPLKDIFNITIHQRFPMGKGGYSNIFIISLRNDKKLQVPIQSFSSCGKKFEELKNISYNNAIQFKMKNL